MHRALPRRSTTPKIQTVAISYRTFPVRKTPEKDLTFVLVSGLLGFILLDTYKTKQASALIDAKTKKRINLG